MLKQHLINQIIINVMCLNTWETTLKVVIRWSWQMPKLTFIIAL